jgi:hypothetical protein
VNDRQANFRQTANDTREGEEMKERRKTGTSGLFYQITSPQEFEDMDKNEIKKASLALVIEAISDCRMLLCSMQILDPRR